MASEKPVSTSKVVSAKKPPVTAEIPKERLQFKSLLLKNPNYFGNFPELEIKPVKVIKGDPTYERITCLGYNPDLSILEATVEIRKPTGYNGSLCYTGSSEYVRFFIDYGTGWEDLGIASFKAHDFADGVDCANKSNKPLIFSAALKIDPKRDVCSEPVLPKVRAILSWQVVPPAGNPNWSPVWGSVLDRHIQIKPRPWKIIDFADLFAKLYDKKIKLPPELEFVGPFEPPLPDPPDLELVDLVKLYKGKGVKKTADLAASTDFLVEPKRFAFNAVQAASKMMYLQPDSLQSSIDTFKLNGLNLVNIFGLLEDTTGDISYEELTCLGLDTNREMLTASFVVKKPNGFSGALCQKGSLEYIAFWVDWENTCEWKYEGTVIVPTHDFANIPAGGLHYAAFLPVYLNPYRKPCSQPQIARVRAVLSWNTPPSNIDPDALPVWGNRLDAHVIIKPGEVSQLEARIRTIAGVPVEDIDYGPFGNAMTKSTAEFAFYDTPVDSLGRACPFGGTIWFTVPDFFPGYQYRISFTREGDPSGTIFRLNNKFKVLRKDFGSDWVIPDPATGWTTFLDPKFYAELPLGYWGSSGDDIWIFWMEIADMAYNILSISPMYRIQLDNTAPTVDIHIAGGGDCKDFAAGGLMSGTFVAMDAHFGAFSLSTMPNTVAFPSNQPTTAHLATSPTTLAGAGWTLNLANPVKMKPCGYVIRIDARDRSIINSVPGSYNWNHTEVGFCLRE